MSEPLSLSRPPAVKVGMLMRRPPHDVYEALADPTITTRFWYTKSSGRMDAGASLLWEWEMYNHSSKVHVLTAEPDRRIVFTWDGYDPEHPSTVEFLLVPHGEHTYLRVTETGFTGDGDAQLKKVADSTGGFTFLLSSVKAWLEHGVELGLVKDAFPAGLEIPKEE